MLSDPEGALEPLHGLVILDEAQQHPELFPLLRVLADRPELPARFLVLGSASPDLRRQAGESLAGRIHYHDFSGLNTSEVGLETMQTLWLRGGFPDAYTARDDRASVLWREDFIGGYLERDLSMMGFSAPPTSMRRFWTMLAHSHGQTFLSFTSQTLELDRLYIVTPGSESWSIGQKLKMLGLGDEIALDEHHV